MAPRMRRTQLLTTKEVARILNVHENTVRRWSDRGIIKPYRIGPRADRRFVAEDVTRLIGELRRSNGDERKAEAVLNGEVARFSYAEA